MAFLCLPVQWRADESLTGRPCFLKEEHFLLIDEPTNHLDGTARRQIAEYLKKKKGFILVSHDRDLLDACVDHIYL